jgi:hypothetical protein
LVLSLHLALDVASSTMSPQRRAWHIAQLQYLSLARIA